MSFKKNLLILLGVLLTVSGCATSGRNYEADINNLNSKMAALQGQVNSKDEEIARLQNDMRQEEAARAQAEAERRMLAEKLDSALEQLQSKSRQSVAVSVTRPDSDLK